MSAFAYNQEKSGNVSAKLQRLARLLQLQSPDTVIAQEIAALRKELADDSMIVTISATVQSK